MKQALSRIATNLIRTSKPKIILPVVQVTRQITVAKPFFVPGYAFASSSYETMKKLNEIEKKFQAEAQAKNYEGCLNLLNEKITIKKKSSTPNTSLINDYRVLGELQMHLGKGNNALNSFEEALKLAIKLDAKEIQAFSLSDIAGIYYSQENFPQAVGYYQESIKLLKEERKTPDKDLALGLLNLGESLVKNGDGDQALNIYSEAKDVLNSLLNVENIDEETLFELNRNKGLVSDALGSLKLQKGDLGEALEDLQTALGIYSGMFGESDAILVSTLTNLAILYQQLGQDEDALKIYKRALNIAEANSTRVQIHEMFSLMLGCAKAYNNLNRFQEAVEMFDKLEAATKANSKNYNSIIPMVKGHKGFLLIQLEEFDRAKKEIEEGLETLKGKDFNIYTAILQTQKAHISLHRESKFEEAFSLAQESYLYIRNLKKDDANCGDCLRIMGLATSKLGDSEKAKEYLKQSLEILEAHPERAEDAQKVKRELSSI